MLNVIPSTYLNLCVHRLIYSTCKDCKGKSHQEENITLFWILDSRASLHFTGNWENFTTFETLYMPIPIYTANRSTFITGKGSVVLKHLSINTKEVATTLESVFFCKDLMCWLLSLGAFLQDGFSVKGSKDLVTVNVHSSIEFMIFKPKMADDTIYVLQILDWVKRCQSTHLVNSIDFEIVYCCFRHSSWEALRLTRKHILEFPIIDIPLFDLVIVAL